MDGLLDSIERAVGAIWVEGCSREKRRLSQEPGHLTSVRLRRVDHERMHEVNGARFAYRRYLVSWLRLSVVGLQELT